MFSKLLTQAPSLLLRRDENRETDLFKGKKEEKFGRMERRIPDFLKHILSKLVNNASRDLFFKDNSCQLLLIPK